MKYTVNEHEEGVDITVEGVENKKVKLLKALQECQEGRCSCPTEEYKKMKSIDIEHDDQNIRLHLKSMQGQTIDKNEIDKCLEYTFRRLDRENE